MPDHSACLQCALCLRGTREKSLAQHYLAHQLLVLEELHAAFMADDWGSLKAQAREAARLAPDVYGRVFSTALTLFYGPAGLREEHRQPDGQPSQEARRLPEVAAALQRAHEEIPGLLEDAEAALRRTARELGF